MGWIKLERDIVYSDIWDTGEPFSKGQAWIDLLLMANFKDEEMYIGYDSITVKRGSMITNMRELCERWHWSMHKLLNFLGFLEREKMIVKKGNAKGTLITVVKYNDYQVGGNAKGTQRERKGNAKGTQKENLLYKEKEGKEYKEGKKNAHGQFENVFLTPDEYAKLCEKIDNADSLIEKLSLYIESTGKKYKSHYATLLNWDRKDNEGKKAAGGNQTSGGYFNAASYVASTIFEGEGLNEIRGD